MNGEGLTAESHIKHEIHVARFHVLGNSTVLESAREQVRTAVADEMRSKIQVSEIPEKLRSFVRVCAEAYVFTPDELRAFADVVKERTIQEMIQNRYVFTPAQFHEMVKTLRKQACSDWHKRETHRPVKRIQRRRMRNHG